MSTEPGHLYLVSTPIGNLDDITFRAVQTLKEVNVIATEDTRHSGVLMKHYGVSTPLLSLHQHNEKQRATQIVDCLARGESVALVSDAGTPLLSDPGASLVQLVIEKGLRVVPVPGACAAIVGLVCSGLPTESFVFHGFLPAKGSKRKKALEGLAKEAKTIVLYESVHRIEDLLHLMKEVMGGHRRVCLARELTKRFETIQTLPVDDWLASLVAHPDKIKGEYVVVIEGEGVSEKELAVGEEVEKILQVLLSELSLKQAVVIAVKLTGLRKKVLYDLALRLSKN